MKLSLSTADLLTQLQTVTRVASTRSAVQALAGVMIAAEEDARPELRATDMEVALRVPLEAEVARPGAAVLPARLLLEVVRALPAAAADARAARRRAGRRADLRAEHVPPAHAARRGLPDAALAVERDARLAADAGVRRHGRASRALRLAR